MILIRDNDKRRRVSAIPFMHGLAFSFVYRRNEHRRFREVYVLMPFNLPVRLLWALARASMRAGYWLKHGK